MKMKSFFAENMQQALKQIREELGSDAVILSSRKLDSGIEVVGALDYDEEAERQHLAEQQNHRKQQGANAGIKRKLEEARQRLTQAHEIKAPPERARQALASVPSSAPLPADADNFSETSKNIAEMRGEIMELRAILKEQISNTADQQQNFSTILRAVDLPVTQPESGKVGCNPVDLASFPQDLQDMYSGLGMLPELQDQLLGNLQSTKDTSALWRNVLANLAHRLSTAENELIDEAGCFALLGPAGAGKTTTIAKLAARFVLKYGPQNIALVTTDRFRVAASQQLQSFGRLLNVPVFVVDEKQNLDDILDRLTDKKLVLVDTAGLNPQDVNWQAQCQDLQVERHHVTNYLVLSAVTQAQVMKANYHHYKKLRISGCMVTKLDEAVSLGEVLSMTILNQLPIAYVTDGQQITRDLHPAKAHALVVRAVEMMQRVAADSAFSSPLIA